MVLHNAEVTGSLTLNNVNISGVTGSAAASASFASQIASLNAYTASANASFSSIETATGSLNTFSGSILSYTSSANARLASIETATGSLNTYTGSNNANIASISANIASLSAGSASAAVTVSAVSQSVVSLNVYTASNDATVNSLAQATVLNAASIASLTSVTRSYATTGSNVFVAPQFINQASNAISFTSTASLYTNGGARVTKDLFVSGTTYLNNLIVYGTSSIQYITSSQVNIGTNIITVNTDTPAVRFGGLAVFDSGSTQLTGSMLWDSEKNHWVYANPSGSSYSGGMIMSGPRSSALGSEQGTTNNALMKGQGGDHITSSAILEDGTLTSMYSTMYVSSSGNVGIGTSTPLQKLHVIGGMWAEGAIGFYTSGGSGLTFADRSGNDLRIYTPSGTTRFVDATGLTTFLTLNNSGNLGLGVTPSAWASGFTALQVKNASFWSTGNDASITANAYYDGSNYRYIGTAGASRTYHNTDGSIIWSQAPSGTAGNAISFTQAMTLNASGNLSVGNTNNTYKLDVTGTARFTGQVNSETLFYAVATPPATNGGLLNIRDTVTATNVTSFAGVFFNSAPGSDYSIGKLTENNAGFLQIRNANNGAELLRINSTGQATFSGKTNIVKSHSDYAFTVVNTDTNGYGIYLQAGSSTTDRNAIDVYNAAGTTQIFKLTGIGAATFASSVRATGLLIGDDRLYMPGNRPISDWLSSSLTIGYSSSNSYGWVNGANNLVLGTDGTERMRITAAGDVGIGTTSPLTMLHVNNGSNGNITSGFMMNMGSTNQGASAYGMVGINVYGGAGNSIYALRTGYNPQFIEFAWSDAMIFHTTTSTFTAGGTITGTEKMRITNAGNVGIGTTSPATKLHVVGSQTLTNSAGIFIEDFYSSGGYTKVGSKYQTTNNCRAEIRFINPSTGADSDISLAVSDAGSNLYNAMYIKGLSGNVGIGTTSPSERLHLNNSSGTGTFIRFQDTSGGGVYIGGRDERMELYAGGSERIRIASDGKVGVNNTSPNNFFDIFSGGPGQSNSVAGLALRAQGGGTFITGRIVARETSNTTQTIATFSASNAINERIFVKVQVVNVSAVSNYGNVHVGYALWIKSGGSIVTTMTLDSGNSSINSTNVGTLSWSGDSLQYTTNGAGNYEMNSITIFGSARDTGVIS